MRSSFVFHSKSSLLLRCSEENEEEGGSYGYSNRTCWKVMTHAHGVTHAYGVVAQAIALEAIRIRETERIDIGKR